MTISKAGEYERGYAAGSGNEGAYQRRIKELEARLAEALPIVRDLTRQITEFTEREGEADFYTGVAVEFLKKQSPCNHVWAKRLRGRDTCAICGVARAADSVPAKKHTPACSYWDGLMAQVCNCGLTDSAEVAP